MQTKDFSLKFGSWMRFAAGRRTPRAAHSLLPPAWVSIIAALALWVVPGIAQGTDPGNNQTTSQGVTVLTQSLNASGAANQQSPVQSFTASGTITFFWAGQQVQAPATILMHGSSQFRLDASLPGGTRSVAVSGNTGARKAEDGTLTPIPLHNTISMGGTSFPYLSIAAALADSTLTVSDVSLVDSGDQQLQKVRVTKNFSADQDPNGIVAKLSQTDYFVDPKTNLVVKVADVTHPIQTLTEDYPREMEFESYSVVSGVAVPTVVRERINGQKVWEFSLSSISFNTNLTDADFSIQ